VTVRVLGPVDVSVDGRPVAVSAPEQAFIVVLALADGHAVTAANLVDALWGETPPPEAFAHLLTLADSLRRALVSAGADSEAVLAEVGGYRLAAAGEPDLWTFDRLVTEARARTAAGWLEAGATTYRSALALWRGAALAELTAAFVDLEAARLEELRLGVLEERIDVDLRLARHGLVVDELAALVIEYPMRERLCAQLMLALYRCDRPDEALSAYRAAERYLQEPGARLRQMHLAVLSGHPSLQAPRHNGSRTGSRTGLRADGSRPDGSRPDGSVSSADASPAEA
jgi:DNA-binding SARP family transcriptional activator